MVSPCVGEGGTPGYMGEVRERGERERLKD
jgi:hypothetical protein